MHKDTPKILLIFLCLTSISSISLLAQTITIQNTTIQSNFQGMGFNMPQISQYNTSNGVQGSTYSTATWNNVLGKRIREACSHGYFRTFNFNIGLYAPNLINKTTPIWTDPKFLNYCKVISFLKDNDIDLFASGGFQNNPTWLGGGKIITDTTVQNDYASAVADGIYYLRNTLGLTNIKSFEITNELCVRDSTGTTLFGRFWGTQSPYRPDITSQNSHKALITKVRAAFDAKGLQSLVIRSGGMGLADLFNFTNDNHPESTMSDFHWYGVYSTTPGWINWGASYGIIPYPPTTTDTTWYLPEQYNYFSSLYKSKAARAKSVSKDCSVGEFGPITPGDANTSFGSSYPGTEYRQIGDGKLGTFIAEQAVAILNAGIITIQKWCMVDAKYNRTSLFYNHGSMTDSIDGWKPRSDWYSYGLMTRYIRKNSSVYNVTSSDNLLRAAAVKNNADGNWTVVVVNRKTTDAPVTITFTGTVPTKPLRKFVYDPGNWPQNNFGDLQEYVKKVSVSGASMTDLIAANTMALYTTEYDETSPAAVTGLNPTSGINTVNLSWNANTDSDFCYYRVYRGATADFVPALSNQIVSTIGTTYKDIASSLSYYKISAVDKYGNASLLNKVTSSVDENYALTDFKITPNPCISGKVQIFSKDIANSSLTVIDFNGREISFAKNEIDQNTMEIQFKANYSTGIYLVNISTKNGIRSKSLIVR